MGLFQKKPTVSNSAPLYTLGLHKTFLIVGLGNIGNEYQNTRHNIGFVCADEIAQNLELPNWLAKKDLKCLVTSGNVGNNKTIIIKPTTYMNLSGDCVQSVANFYKIPSEQTVVIHDELDIDFGQVRIKLGGSDGGHNGVKSIIQNIGAQFMRIRIGINNPSSTNYNSADFVLAKFSKEESSSLPKVYKEVVSIITEYLYGDGQMDNETRKFL